MSIKSFEQWLGHPPTLSFAAPGRVNLIGEHTDYNLGYVLPSAIPQKTQVDLQQRNDQQVRVYAAQMQVEGTYSLGAEQAGQGWLDYVQGVTKVLSHAGHAITGFDAFISSDVPVGSGLSSSAALLVALIKGLRELCDLRLDDVQVARLAQRAENDFVGARVGIMDQMACSLADEGSALFLDCRSLEFRQIMLPKEAELVVIHSGLEHQHAGGDYNARRAECEAACELLGVESLRELDEHDLDRINALPEPLNRRARHVISENARVLATVEAIKNNDLGQIGMLFWASHDSMRDDYAVSIAPIDRLIELAKGSPNIYGARMTGGGFGGSVVMLAKRGLGRAAGQAIAAAYAAETGNTPRVLT
jgi:galactokinase